MRSRQITAQPHLCQVKLAACDVDVSQCQPGALKLVCLVRLVRQLGHALHTAVNKHRLVYISTSFVMLSGLRAGTINEDEPGNAVRRKLDAQRAGRRVQQCTTTCATLAVQGHGLHVDSACPHTLSWLRAFAVCLSSRKPCAKPSSTGTLLGSALAMSSSWLTAASTSGRDLVAISVYADNT
jgi:hypothetical protein